MRHLLIPAALLLLLSAATMPRPRQASAGANLPPVVTILSPADGDSFAPGTMITFSATAIDPETGPLGGVFMFWASNIQGGLGIGTSFSRSDLITGTHVVTLRATDPNGLQTARSITITVGVPTATPTATSTPTPVPPTATSTPTPVPLTATSTPTPVPPTATSTPTPRPPMATSTPTPAPAKTAHPSRTPTPTPIPHPGRCADVDGDGRVTWKDVRLIAKAIHEGSKDPRFDVDGDGKVTFRDLRVALFQLGRKCHRHGPGASPTPTATRPPKPTATPTPAPPEPTATPTVAPEVVPPVEPTVPLD
jgi:chitinase